MSKKLITILSIICAAVAVALAVVMAWWLVKMARNNHNEALSNESSLSDTSSAIPVGGTLPEEEKAPEILLTFSSPQKDNITVTEPKFQFVGSSDPAQPLTMNDKEVARNADGTFSFDVDLSVGNNTFTFFHKGQAIKKSIRYRYVVIQAYSPSTSKSFESGTVFSVVVNARAGSTVASEFNGQTIQLVPAQLQTDENTVASDTFIDFIGQFALPKDNTTNLSLGKVWVSATYNGVTETFSSGNIVCKKKKINIVPDDTIPPNTNTYNNVGAGYIAEVVGYTAETFTTSDPNLWCLPTNNYLPYGTVDYCSPNFYHENSSDLTYVALRCGKSILIDKKDLGGMNRSAVTKCYEGMLPDHNEIGLAYITDEGHHSLMVIDTMWKAPFRFELKPQGFANAAAQDYTFQNATFTYVDITFCYATVLTDSDLSLPADHPLFSGYEIIKNEIDYTLRLHLRKPGAFYGWDSYYNGNGDLTFKFLLPTAATRTDANRYGANLSGIKILLDVGHGGIDGGAAGFNPKLYTEATQNLYLAHLVRQELESMGATVIMNRTDNATAVNQYTRCKQVKDEAPDLVLAIHHNSAKVGSANGFEAYYYAPFSKKAVESIFHTTAATGIYAQHKLGWHAYYTGRMSSCPVILTENGYMSNWGDYNNIISETMNQIKAQALAQGIANYFLSLAG